MQLHEIIEQFIGPVERRYDEPMAPYTSFKIGGPADVMLFPSTIEELQRCLVTVKEFKLPFLLLGGGTNMLVSDRGVRGVVIQTSSLNHITINENTLIAEAGALVEDVSETAADNSLQGLEFIYGMPGSIGGAVWMNARCYGASVSDVLGDVEIVTSRGELRQVDFNPDHYDYKISPFQNMDGCICRVKLHLEPGNKDEILAEMQENLEDRKGKGHFAAPSAGSLFKNNRKFGAPTGKILDELGLRGAVQGGAAIAPFHGNIFINQDNAKATDVVSLIKLAVEKAEEKRKIHLEPEIRFVGDWHENELSFL